MFLWLAGTVKVEIQNLTEQLKNSWIKKIAISSICSVLILLDFMCYVSLASINMVTMKMHSKYGETIVRMWSMKEAFLQWCMYKGNVLVSRKIMIPIYLGYDYMASMDYMDPDVRCPQKRLLNIITHSLVSKILQTLVAVLPLFATRFVACNLFCSHLSFLI